MSSLKNLSSMGHQGGKDGEVRKQGEVIKKGYLKKLKTMKKKFFVLRGDSPDVSSRIEYYDSEKKWKANNAPKRCITLKTCFNINRRTDTKHKHVLALYTKDENFSIVLESKEELEDWLKALLSLQHGEDIPDGTSPKPTFEHVWQVNVQKKGLGSSKNLHGTYRLCLTNTTLSLVKMTQDEYPETIDFSLNSIRRCGYSDCFFYMEIGRQTVTGAGDLWMETEDTNIAENMHSIILHSMNNCPKDEIVPRPRNRSSSANEASKPISVLQRRPTNVADVHPVSQSHYKLPVSYSEHIPSAYGTSVESHSHALVYGSVPSSGHRAALHVPTVHVSQRRHSVSGSSSRERCDSLPSRARTISEGHPPPPPHSNRNTHLAPGCGRPHSMYSRPTISHSPPVGSSPVSPASGPCSTDSAGSSLSIEDGEAAYGEVAQDAIQSSTRYGHSLTPDEPAIQEENSDDYDPWPGPGGISSVADDENSSYMRMDKSTAVLSLPIQPMTVGKGQLKYSPILNSSGFKSGSPSQSSYMEMYSPCGSSPLETPGGYMPMSPGEPPKETNSRLPYLGRSLTSSSHIPLSSSANHSRTSSLAEETPDGYVPFAPVLSDDGYVDMDPLHSNRSIGDDHHSEMSPASSCSITSGTPSTDLRFSEYHLEKVSSYFTPSEEDETSSLERPIRAYSVGSRPDGFKKKNRLEVLNSESSRVRAFSVGSRMGMRSGARPLVTEQTPSKEATPPTGKKSSSAPLLSSSWSESSSLRHHPSTHSSTEPMDDLMEIDFSRNREKTSVPLLKPNSKSPYTRQKREHDMGHQQESGKLSTSIGDTDYLDMTGGSVKISSSPGSSKGLSAAKVAGPYVEMKVGGDLSIPSVTKPMTIIKTASPILEEYVDMNFKKTGKDSAAKTKPIDTPKIGKPPDGYMEMSWSSKSRRASQLGKESFDTEGYKEMSPGKVNQDIDSPGDYMNMSFGSSDKNFGDGKRDGGHRAEPSQPIIIQVDRSSASGRSGSVSKGPKSSSPVFSFTNFISRKGSTGTPPKIPFLPLGNDSHPPKDTLSTSPFSSLRRSKSNKTKKNNEEKQHGQSDATTPTGEPPMFPANSASPVKLVTSSGTRNLCTVPPLSTSFPPLYDSSPKCMVDATSGTVKIPHAPLSTSVPSSFIARNAAVLEEGQAETDAKVSHRNSILKEDPIREEHDYMNFNPQESSSVDISKTSCNGETEIDTSDYATMSPAKSPTVTRKTSNSPAQNRKVENKVVSGPEGKESFSLSNADSYLASRLAKLHISSSNESDSDQKPDKQLNTVYSSSFPVWSSESNTMHRQLSMPVQDAARGSVTSLGEQELPIERVSESEASVSGASCVGQAEGFSAYENLSIGSCSPNRTSRPPSVSSERELNYASLDLAPSSSEGDEGTKSPRSLKSQSSTGEGGQGERFSYAEIDFAKSEGLKNVTSSLKRKARH